MYSPTHLNTSFGRARKPHFRPSLHFLSVLKLARTHNLSLSAFALPASAHRTSRLTGIAIATHFSSRSPCSWLVSWGTSFLKQPYCWDKVIFHSTGLTKGEGKQFITSTFQALPSDSMTPPELSLSCASLCFCVCVSVYVCVSVCEKAKSLARENRSSFSSRSSESVSESLLYNTDSTSPADFSPTAELQGVKTAGSN